MSTDPRLQEAFATIGELFVQLRIANRRNQLLEQQLIKQADPFSKESAVKDSDDAN